MSFIALNVGRIEEVFRYAVHEPRLPAGCDLPNPLAKRLRNDDECTAPVP